MSSFGDLRVTVRLYQYVERLSFLLKKAPKSGLILNVNLQFVIQFKKVAFYINFSLLKVQKNQLYLYF